MRGREFGGWGSRIIKVLKSASDFIYTTTDGVRACMCVVGSERRNILLIYVPGTRYLHYFARRAYCSAIA